MAKRALMSLFLSALLATCLCGLARAEDQEGCFICHGLPGFGLSQGGSYHSLSLKADEFNAARHGQLACRGCHREIVAIPHERGAALVNCGLDCHATQSSTGKPYTHETLYWGFMASAHGKNLGAPLSCLDCHPHDPPAGTGIEPREMTARCAICHLGGLKPAPRPADAARVERYFRDVHGRILLAGGRAAPACPDCHTAHTVLPSSKDDSATGRGHVGATCSGRNASGGEGSCHHDAATAALVGMSPLSGSGWREFPGGWFFLYAGIIGAGLLVVRIILRSWGAA